MRDPDLMQRADRAAIGLEQAWERWRAMHGLGAEPLPPVSSYVGYSLEEPWGQPRVVFGLRADEAELLTSLLEGHDCVGSVYSELSARSDWRLPVSGPVSMPGRGYGGPLNVPAQAPPPGTDPLPPVDGFASGRLVDEDLMPADEPDDEPARSQGIPGSAGPGSARARARAARPDRAGRRSTGAVPDAVDPASQDDDVAWSAADGDAVLEADLDTDLAAEATAVPQSPPLAPLPDMADPRQRSDEAGPSDPDQPGAAPRPAGNAIPKTRGPGYRGPRYQGFPPRYDTSPSAAAARARRAAVADDEESTVGGADSTPTRKTHVAAKLSRSARRRTQGD